MSTLIRAVPLGFAIALLAACSQKSHDAPLDVAIANPLIFSANAATATIDAAIASASPSAIATTAPSQMKMGSATLVVERVRSVCMLHTDKPFTSFLGNDVLVETLNDTGVSVAPLVRDSAFCPKHVEDAGNARPKKNMWGMCNVYPDCKILSVDAGDDRAELQCGADHIVLESASGRTILHGPNGDREIAPFPMRISPSKKSNRDAHVDC